MKFDSMWLRLGLLGSAVGIGIAIRWFARRRRSRPIDVGSVSEAWLAEQRGRTDETW